MVGRRPPSMLRYLVWFNWCWPWISFFSIPEGCEAEVLNESPVPGNKAQQPCCAKLVYRALQFLMQAKPPSCRQYTVGARIGSLGKGSQRKTLGSLGPRVPRPPLRASPFPPASFPNDLHQVVVHKAASSVPPVVVLLTPGRKHEEWKTTFTC